MKVAAVVCAAGEAKRFGGTVKCLLPFGEKTLLHRLLETLSEGGFSEIALVVGHGQREVAEAARDFLSVRCVENPRYAEGLGTSLACGVKALGDAEGIALFLADKPFVRAETVRALLSAFRAEGKEKIVHPSHGGEQGHPVLFPARFRGELESLEGPRGAKDTLLAHTGETHAVETSDAGVVEDVDAPGDYEALRVKYGG